MATKEELDVLREERAEKGRQANLEELERLKKLGEEAEARLWQNFAPKTELKKKHGGKLPQPSSYYELDEQAKESYYGD